MSVPASITALTNQTHALRERLITWAEINSGSEHTEGLHRMAAVLRAALLVFTPDVALLPAGSSGRSILRARLRPEAPTRILLNGHYDTVYEADHPFQRCTLLSPDRLNGPGVSDMKGGIVTLLAALSAFEKTPHAGRLGFEILLTPDEETGSYFSAPEIAAAARRNDFGLVFEPARPGGEIVRSRKGTGSFTAVCHGRSAHGAVPEEGRNAIVALAEFITAVNQVPADLPGVLLNVGNVRGGGAINIVPDRAQVELHVRINHPADQRRVLDRLHALAKPINARDGYRLEIHGGFDRPPKECLPAEESVFNEWRRAAADLGQPVPGWIHTGGGSDGNLLSAAGLPCLDGVGPVGGDLHSPTEWIDLPSIAQRAQLAALVLHRIATGEFVLPAKPAGLASAR
jgi:glutamate carboxypeptidase